MLLSAGGALLAALLLFLLEPPELAALLLPVAVHEAAHLLALKALGLRVRRIRAELKGFCIDYGGYSGALGHALVAASGPTAGLAYAFACSFFAARSGGDWLELSAGCSLLLSLFNLLPALPLDGGRIVESLSCAILGQRRGDRLTEICSLSVGALLLALGMWIMFSGGGIAVELAAVWLLFSQDKRRGIEKLKEVL